MFRFVSLSVVVIFFASLGPAYTQTAHWNFDGTVDDQSGNGFHGVIHGDPVYVAGINGQALDFDGSGDAVELPAISIVDATEFSVAWMFFVAIVLFFVHLCIAFYLF